MITVGLDFGTHQTKVCIENRDGVEINYSFMQFEDCNHCMSYTIPSVIGIDRQGLLYYGYLPDIDFEYVIKYFKQNTFNQSKNYSSQSEIKQVGSIYFSIWFIAYILFDLEHLYGQEFTIQMGAPSDSSHIEEVKEIATQIVASAYRLVEDVFNNDKQEFLKTTFQELINKTEIVDYSKEVKEEYGLLVFPEAYACLKPIINQGKLASGMSLMIDIGGGTTDISFFTIENNQPQVYDFYTINKGLNFLTEAKNRNLGTSVNIVDESEIKQELRKVYFKKIHNICNSLRDKLLDEFKKQTTLKEYRLLDALKNRPLVYSGGGSTFKCLRNTYLGFQEKKQISHNEWNVKCVKDIEDIINLGLCPILSTAYGLAISTENDNIVMKPFRDIFENLRSDYSSQNASYAGSKTFGSALGGFNYMDDWSACK